MREAQGRCSSREFAEWVAYEAIEPFGCDRTDVGFAIVASTVAKSVGAKNVKLRDFMPQFKSGSRRMPEKELQMRWEAFASMHNAVIEQRKRK